jgi:hypothetical protein
MNEYVIRLTAHAGWSVLSAIHARTTDDATTLATHAFVREYGQRPTTITILDVEEAAG